ncbi:hypothetical protein FACS18949_12090 [Clostridia bacterium]|nr:hypothetical protein FACS18949_12090 [Clostridia bacterium]
MTAERDGVWDYFVYTQIFNEAERDEQAADNSGGELDGEQGANTQCPCDAL